MDPLSALRSLRAPALALAAAAALLAGSGSAPAAAAGPAPAHAGMHPALAGPDHAGAPALAATGAAGIVVAPPERGHPRTGGDGNPRPAHLGGRDAPFGALAPGALRSLQEAPERTPSHARAGLETAPSTGPPSFPF